MKYLKKTIPKNWKANDTEKMNNFFNKLPIVNDLEEVEAIDKRYELMKEIYYGTTNNTQGNM